jgi:hypothetical protein
VFLCRKGWGVLEGIGAMCALGLDSLAVGVPWAWKEPHEYARMRYLGGGCGTNTRLSPRRPNYSTDPTGTRARRTSPSDGHPQYELHYIARRPTPAGRSRALGLIDRLRVLSFLISLFYNAHNHGPYLFHQP